MMFETRCRRSTATSTPCSAWHGGLPPLHGGASGELADEVVAMVRAQAEKRVGLQFVERDARTWDHRKLGGVY